MPGKSHGWRSVVGYSPWALKESDTTERLHFTKVLVPKSGEIRCGEGEKFPGAQESTRDGRVESSMVRALKGPGVPEGLADQGLLRLALM